MEERLNKTYKIAIAALIISILCLLLIIGGKFSIKSSENTSTNSEESTTTDNSYDVSSFNSLSVSQLVGLFNDKNNTYVVYLGRPTCSACVSFIPTLKSMQNKYGYITQYLDIETITAGDQAYNELMNKLSKKVTLTVNGETKTQSFGEFFGYTPMTFIIKNGKFVDGIVGAYSESSFEAFLNKNGIK